jgi:hypothetical protein
MLSLIWVDANYDGSKVARVPISKVHIHGKINIRMKKNSKNHFGVGPMW